MLELDPQLFEPKVIRMSTTSSCGRHLVRTTHVTNAQVMTGTHLHNEFNNNILTSNNTDFTTDDFRRGLTRNRRVESDNYNAMEESTEGEWNTEQMVWSSGGDSDDPDSAAMLELLAQQNSSSIISFESNLSSNEASFHSQEDDSAEAKEELIASLLGRVRSQNKAEASKTLLAMSQNADNCMAMRQCGCLPMLVRLLHGDEGPGPCSNGHAHRAEAEIRARAGLALRNVVSSQPDDKKGRREGRVLKLLEQIREYSEQLREEDDNRRGRCCVDQQIGPSVAALMKLSFDEDHRFAMCQLGGLQAIADLLQSDNAAHGVDAEPCVGLRRYSGMALTNLTFGDGANKSLLCSWRPFMEALVAQLASPSEDLRQVTASVLRNLSWRADAPSKRALREVGAVPLLVSAALGATRESTLKSILSALWNLSAHCSANKADICAVEGALAFLVSTLTYRSKSRTLSIVENGGGILRNVSSHVAIQNEYRAILRRHNCLQILLVHLKSPSLTVVSNACGTLWNLSARNATDQRALWEMGAVGMLKKLIHSKHKMISMGSSAALKNLLSARPPGVNMGLCVHGDNYRCEDEPSLMVRKQKALSTELDENLAETYDNTDSPKTSPVKQQGNNRTRRHVSPSAARYLANQKLKAELSLPSRGANNTGGSFVVEERHNGAFQVTKNVKQTPESGLRQPDIRNAFRQPEVPRIESQIGNRQQQIPRPDFQTTGIGNRQQQIARNDAQASRVGPSSANGDSKLAFRPTRADKPDGPRYSKSVDSTRNGSPSPVCLKKESGIPKPTADPKPPHDSRIPLPRSVNQKLDSQRSQSSSPVAPRRNIKPPESNTKKAVDVSETRPKYAWSSSPEKQDDTPEQTANFAKRFAKQDATPEQTDKVFVKPLKLQCDEGAADERRLRNSSSNYSLEDDGVPKTRCSLNIRTNTNVRMISNHPLLANAAAHRAEDEGRLFESRRSTKDKHFQNYDSGGGKTVEFSVQGDYDFDESLSVLSRSSSTDSFERHEEESCASSNGSRRTSNVASPSELTECCETAPTSPLPSSSNYLSLCDDALPSPDETLYVDVQQSVTEDCLVTACDDVQSTQTEVAFHSLEDSDIIVLHDDPEDQQLQQRNFEEVPCSSYMNTRGILQTEKQFQDECSQVETAKREMRQMEDLPQKNIHHDKIQKQEIVQVEIPQQKNVQQEIPKQKTQEQEIPQMIILQTEIPKQKIFQKRVQRQEIPRPKTSQQKEIVQREVPKQKIQQQDIPQLSYHLEEKHPRAFNFERGNPLKNLEIKDTADYESLSENEEKGKEDERKAEKNRLFRIPESPVDPKRSTAPDAGSRKKVEGKVAPQVPSQLEFLMTGKIVEEQNKSARVEKKKSDSSHVFGKPQEKSIPSIPTQLEFLMNKDSHSIQKEDTKVSKNISNDARTSSEVQNFGKDDADENMASSAILDEARFVAEALMGARSVSTEDMTVSTLSCLSDVDNARPPSVMAEVDCMSSSGGDFTAAVTRECQKIFGKTNSSKHKSLLRELQMGRLGGANSDDETASVRSNCTSELLGNVCPPSMLDDISMTASSLDSDSDSEMERNLVGRYASHQDDASERIHDAAAMAHLYAKELSNMTGNNVAEPNKSDEVVEVTIADTTEMASDTELDDDLPCDDLEEDPEETLQLNNRLERDDSAENLNFSLTDEPADDMFDFQRHSGCFMTTEEFKALQENADMILNTLKDIEISDEEENGEEDNSHGDMLDDETMSLVSNESDDDFLSPEGHPQPQTKTSPRGDFLMSPSCNGMVALPQISDFAVPKSRKTNLPPRNKYSGLPRAEPSVPRNTIDDPVDDQANVDALLASEPGAFDSRTFTKKKASFPKEMDQTARRCSLKSPMSSNSPSFPQPPKTVESKISAAWKNAGKTRSKSAADVNRNSKLKAAGSSVHPEDANGYSQRSNSLTPSLSRSNTSEKLNDDELSQQPSIRRPSSLALAQKTNSPRHAPMQKTANEIATRQPSKGDDVRKYQQDAPSPSANIPKAPNKIQQGSLIPARRSMIPMPAKFGLPEN